MAATCSETLWDEIVELGCIPQLGASGYKPTALSPHTFTVAETGDGGARSLNDLPSEYT